MSMRFLSITGITLVILYAAISIAGPAIMMSASPTSYSDSKVVTMPDTGFGGIFNHPFIEASHKRIEDSLKRIQDDLELSNEGSFQGVGLGPVGLYTLSEHTPNAQPGHEQYYFALMGYTPKDGFTKFFIDKGTYNLAYVVTDSITKGFRSLTGNSHYERKEIPVRYSSHLKAILIPVTKGEYAAYYATAFAIFMVILLAACYFTFVAPCKIIFAISKGKAFTRTNVQRFNRMAIVGLGLALLSLLSPYVLKLIYHNYIPGEFTLAPFFIKLLDMLPVCILAFVVAIIGKAFEKGYNLQKENDLTI